MAQATLAHFVALAGLPATAAALRGSRYLKVNGWKPEEDPAKITGFYALRDGRWMYLHCNFFNLRGRNLAVLGTHSGHAVPAA